MSINYLFMSIYRTKKTMLVSIMANASHLESINPVIVGRVRAEQVEKGDFKGIYRREYIIF